MKHITNWANATVFDAEADGLLDEATKIHVLSYEMANGNKGSIPGDEHGRLRTFFKWHIDKGIPVVAHNGVRYDIPLAEKILDIDLSELMVIDTLFLSWYLNTKRKSHGLESFFKDYGIEKVKVDESQWAEGDYDLMKLRCQVDVDINMALWKDFMNRLRGMYGIASKYLSKGLVGGTRLPGEEIYLDQIKDLPVEGLIDNALTFLMFKADSAKLREDTRWLADVPRLHSLNDELSELIVTAKTNLESVMPDIPKYTVRNKPKVMKKKDGSFSAAGVRWNRIARLHNRKIKDEHGNLMALGVDAITIKELTSYSDPNANSHQQIKDFLFLHGWEPENYDYKVDKKDKEAWASSGFKKELKPVPRKVPQVSIEGEEGKELCPSVEKLIEKVPEIENYSKYTLVKHRLDMVKGWIERLSEDGYLTATIGGMASSLRDQHSAPLVNLPGAKKPYGKDIRGALKCTDDEILLGTDLSSLEDKVKQHFLLPIDPDYVATMMDDSFDPHIENAFAAGLITKQQYEDHKKGIKSEEVSIARAQGKTATYACAYNGGPEAIAKGAGVDISVGKKLHEGYWKINWGVKKIAEEQIVFDYSYIIPDNGEEMKQRWLINPVNGICYECRKDSDRFSILCQGTGSFFFDCWLDGIITKITESSRKVRVCLNMHDETVLPLKNEEEEKELYKGFVNSALEDVNEKYMLRIKLGCDTQYGRNYSEIH